MFLASPLAGWNEDKLEVPSRNGTTVLKDTAGEYGLFLMLQNRRMTVNNTIFYTEPNDARVSGDIFYVNFFGPPERRLTWNVGAGYIWHRVDMDREKITISSPMMKAGLIARDPELHLTVNPYVGYLWEDINTTHADSNYESMLYGIAASWDWRMLHATLKYYLQDNLDTHKQYDVFRAYGFVFMGDRWGLAARFEYMEHTTGTDTSFMFGPAFVF